MTEPVKEGRDLLEEIESSECPSPTLWWLGHSGFVLKYRQAILYVDPCLSESAAAARLTRAPFSGADVTHAGLILCTHRHEDHLDPGTAPDLIRSSPRSKLVVPKSLADHAHSIGVPYHRMVTTDSNLRVEFMDDRVYAVPSAHDQLDWTPIGGYPYLGYLVRFGRCTIYHAGDGVPYGSLAERLRPYAVDVALLPISGRTASETTFDHAQAAQLAEDIGARWLIPMHYGMFANNTGDIERFIEHMLGHRPMQRFKVFQCGERWMVPGDPGEQQPA